MTTTSMMTPVSPRWQDDLGRSIGYLRLSLTSACSMRCTYCRPSVLRESLPSGQMSPHDIEQLVRHLVRQWGLHKVRLTGGEPTTRPDLCDIIARLASIPGLTDLAMTTNGLTLPRQASRLRQAGLHRVNISLDSLDEAAFRRMTGMPGPQRVIDGIDAAIEAGLGPIRLNSVVVAGDNDRHLPDLVSFAADRQLEIRFIELMPMGPLANQWSSRFVTAQTMQTTLQPLVTRWTPMEQGHDSAKRFRVELIDGRQATVGFITPMSCDFCAACDRLRITAGGQVYPCLMDQPRGNITQAMRPVFDPDRFDQILLDCLDRKAPRHPAHGYTQMTILGG